MGVSVDRLKHVSYIWNPHFSLSSNTKPTTTAWRRQVQWIRPGDKLEWQWASGRGGGRLTGAGDLARPLNWPARAPPIVKIRWHGDLAAARLGSAIAGHGLGRCKVSGGW